MSKLIVHKYGLEGLNRFTIKMPKGAEILKCDSQNNVPVMWALVDREEELEEREFISTGTGHEMTFEKNDGVLKFIGTTTHHSGTFILHFFEITRTRHQKIK